MKTLNEVASVIQVGTQRAALPNVDFLPETPGEKAEKRALVLAGTLDLMRRAGGVGVDSVKPLPTAPQEIGRVAQASEAPLSEALDKKMIHVVLEWAAKAKQVRAVLPPALLTAILPLVKKHRDELLPIIGERGHWLGQLQGLDLSPSDDEEFAAKRTEDPAAYREWLTAEYEAMDWKERLKAVKQLQIQLSIHDEPILEIALKDRRKEIREAALELLASQASFKVAHELALLAAPNLNWKKSFLSTSLIIEAPERSELPKWLPKSPWVYGMGPKAMALIDVVSYVPPSTWVTNGSREKFFEHVGKSDYHRAMLEGLIVAAVRFKDQPWIDALYELLVSRPDIYKYKGRDLAAHASPEMFERIALKGLRGEVYQSGLIVSLIIDSKRPLSFELSCLLIDEIKTSAQCHALLPFFALNMHVDAISRTEVPIEEHEVFENSRLEGRNILSLRKRLVSSLDL
jgi:hypothetical protein